MIYLFSLFALCLICTSYGLWFVVFSWSVILLNSKLLMSMRKHSRMTLRWSLGPIFLQKLPQSISSDFLGLIYFFGPLIWASMLWSCDEPIETSSNWSSSFFVKISSFSFLCRHLHLLPLWSMISFRFKLPLFIDPLTNDLSRFWGLPTWLSMLGPGDFFILV